MALHPDVKTAILTHEFPGADATGPQGSPLLHEITTMVDHWAAQAVINRDEAVLIVVGVYTFRDNPMRLASYLDSL